MFPFFECRSLFSSSLSFPPSCLPSSSSASSAAFPCPASRLYSHHGPLVFFINLILLLLLIITLSLFFSFSFYTFFRFSCLSLSTPCPLPPLGLSINVYFNMYELASACFVWCVCLFLACSVWLFGRIRCVAFCLFLVILWLFRFVAYPLSRLFVFVWLSF